MKLKAATLEEQWNVKLPVRLRQFFEQGEWQEYEGHQISGLTHFTSDTRTLVSFVERDGLPEKFEYAGEFVEEPDRYWPLCDLPDLDGTFFVAVDLGTDKLPVCFFDYESGYHPHSESFDGFLASLLKPGDRTQSEELDALYKQAKQLYNDDRYEECRALLEDGLARLGDLKVEALDKYSRLPAATRNLLALAYKGLGNAERAMETFSAAAENGDKSAALNIISILLDRKEWQRAVDYAEEKARSMYMLFDDYSAFYSFLYRGLGFAHMGDAGNATKFFGFVATRFLEKDPTRIAEAIEELQKIEDEPAASIARTILAWLQPPPLQLSPDAAQELKNWWKSIDGKELRAALCELMEKKSTEVRPEDLARLARRTDLDLDHKDVEDISFLRKFTRLRKLSIAGDQIRDIGPLAELQHLTDLGIEGNPIEDFSPVSKLTRLIRLDLSETGLVDLTPLRDLHELRKLRLVGNKIRSVEPIAHLPELIEVTLYDNQIEDLNPLAGNLLLKEISCFANPLEDRGIEAVLELRNLPLLDDMDAEWDEDELTPAGKAAWQEARPFTRQLSESELKDWIAWWRALSDEWRSALEGEIDELEDGVPTAESFFELRKEGHFSLGEKKVQDLTPITRLERADYINAGSNEIQVLPDLSALGCLRTLRLDDNPIQDLRPLGALPYIAYLDLDKCQLEDISSLPELPSLRRLDLNHNRIVDVSALERIPNLRRLELIDNQIESVQALARLGAMRQLFLQQNSIRDVSPLAACKNLEELVVFGNPELQGLLKLKDLPHLILIRAHGAFPPQDLSEFRALRPDVDVL